MGYRDAQNNYSDAQALTVTAVSTNLIDHGQDRNLGVGTQLLVEIAVDVAAGGTSPTMAVVLQTDDNAAFSSAATVATSPTFAQADMTAGAVLYVPVPPDTRMERFSRLSYTMGGTSPTVTVTAFLIRASDIQAAPQYAAGVTVS
jgi:hypothetical protein